VVLKLTRETGRRHEKGSRPRARSLFHVEQLDYRMTWIVLLADLEPVKFALPP
jgi:hypothetical protein